MDTPSVSSASATTHLERVLASAAFANAARSSTLLRFLVEETVGGRAERLKEYTLGTEALGRGDTFDPKADPIVRAEVSRLRSRLDSYYATEGRSDPVVIVLPKGSYAPRFQSRPPPVISEALSPLTGTIPAGRPPLIWVAFGALVGGIIAAGVWWGQRDVAVQERPLVRLEVGLRAGEAPLGSEVGPDVTISPDGTRLLFVGYGSDRATHLYTRRLDASRVTELPGTAGARGPFFSPDGEAVVFWAAGHLQKTRFDGRLPVVLCAAADLLGGSWGDTGVIVATLDSTPTLWRVPTEGGTPTRAADFTSDPRLPRWPQVLPGGKAVLFSMVGPENDDTGTIDVLSLADGSRKTFVHGGAFGRYVPTGHLIYLNQGTLWAVPFDLDGLSTRGVAAAVLDDVAYSARFGYGQFDYSQEGTFVYRRNPDNGHFVARWIDVSGKSEPLLQTPGKYLWPRLSPDGERLAIAVSENGATHLAVYERRSGRTTRVTSGAKSYNSPVWSPDGRFIVFQGVGGMFWLRADAPGPPQQLTVNHNTQVPWSFTPDGTRLAFHEMSAATGFDLWTVPVATDGASLRAGKAEPFLQAPAFQLYPAFSPDGRWIAYGSNESGTWDVYVSAFPGNGTIKQVSAGGGRIPRWPSSGRDLFYGTDDQRLMSAPYTVSGGTFSAGKPRQFVDVQLGDTNVAPNYEIAPGGTRAIALFPVSELIERQAPNHVTFLLNFFDELRRRSSNPPR